MPALLKDALMVVVLAVVIGAAVKGSIYARQVWQEGHSSDTLLQSKQFLIMERQKSAAEIFADLSAAKSMLAIEAAKLSDMQAGFSLSAFKGFIIEEQTSLQNALWSSDPFFDSPRSATPTLSFKTDAATAARLEQLRKEINAIVDSWKNNSNSISSGTINTINEYLNELHDIVSGLTPGNSGLTQEQIDNYQQAIENAQHAVEQATNPPGGSPVTPEDIQNQQNVVDNSQQHVDDIQSIIDENNGGGNGGGNGSGDTGGTGSGDTGGGGSGDTGGTGGTGGSGGDAPPSTASGPVTPSNNGKPTLIQGTNSF